MTKTSQSNQQQAESEAAADNLGAVEKVGAVDNEGYDLETYLKLLEELRTSITPVSAQVSEQKENVISGDDSSTAADSSNRVRAAADSRADIEFSDIIQWLRKSLIPDTLRGEKIKSLLSSPRFFGLVEWLADKMPASVSRVVSALLHGVIIISTSYAVITQEGAQVFDALQKVTLLVKQPMSQGKLETESNKVDNESVPNDLAEKSAMPSENLSGIDVSHYQGTVDWDTIKNSRISFAFIKVTEGRTYVDPKYSDNVAGAKQAEILHGAYHFYQPAEDAEEQAMNFITHVKGTVGDLPPVLDIEITQGIDKSELVDGIKVWLKTVEQHTGCRPIVYSYLVGRLCKSSEREGTIATMVVFATYRQRCSVRC
jgi:GH25 family lysozyme M1 (1,4-beta-N-acetylmuramidase)